MLKQEEINLFISVYMISFQKKSQIGSESIPLPQLYGSFCID